MTNNFLKAFQEKHASYKSKLLYKISRGFDVKLKNFSKKSILKTKAGKGK